MLSIHPGKVHDHKNFSRENGGACGFSERFWRDGYLHESYFAIKTRRSDVKTLFAAFLSSRKGQNDGRNVRDDSQLREILRILRRYPPPSPSRSTSVSFPPTAVVHYDNDNNDGNKTATSPFCRARGGAPANREPSAVMAARRTKKIGR